MKLTEADILNEDGPFFVLRVTGAYEVRRNIETITEVFEDGSSTTYDAPPGTSMHDSSYPKTEGGLSLAIARCAYQARRYRAKLRR